MKERQWNASREQFAISSLILSLLEIMLLKLGLVLNVSQEQSRCVAAEVFPQKDSLSDLSNQEASHTLYKKIFKNLKSVEPRGKSFCNCKSWN